MITTERLILRPWEAGDRAAFGALLNTPAMTAHLGGPRSEAGVDSLFAKRLADYDRHGTCYWAVVHRADGALAGSCGVRVADDYPDTPVAGVLEAGWRIGEAFWGRGLATEAAAASIVWLRKVRGPARVFSWTTAGNAASPGVMQALGMQRSVEHDFIRQDNAEACVVYAEQAA